MFFRAYENFQTDLAANDINNPVLKGWAFELEQIDFIRLSRVSPDESPKHVTNNNGLFISYLRTMGRDTMKRNQQC
jgi:hypothetical protein